HSSPAGPTLSFRAFLHRASAWIDHRCILRASQGRRASMFSFFRRRKEADATARRIIDQGCFLGARTPREAVEMSWGRPLSDNEWFRYASKWERIWRESLKKRPIESEMRPPHQLRLAISAVTAEPVSGKMRQRMLQAPSHC